MNGLKIILRTLFHRIVSAGSIIQRVDAVRLTAATSIAIFV